MLCIQDTKLMELSECEQRREAWQEPFAYYIQVVVLAF